MKTNYMLSSLTTDPNERIFLIKQNNGLSDAAFEVLKKAFISSVKIQYAQFAVLASGSDYDINLPLKGELSIRVRKLPFIRYEKDEIDLLDAEILRKIRLEQFSDGRQLDAVIKDGGYRLTVFPDISGLSKVYPSNLSLLQALSDLEYEIRGLLLSALARRSYTLSLLEE